MDHTQANDTHAAERYLLGELSVEDAEEFERHYFDCAQCAVAVESGRDFIENARAVFGEAEMLPQSDAVRQHTGRRPESAKPAPGKPAWWRMPSIAIAFSMAAIFAGVAVYQGAFLIPQMRRTLESARALPAFQLVGASRGEAAPVHVPPLTPSFALSMDIPPDAHFAKYFCVVTSGNHATGHEEFRVEAAAPAAGQPITILIPAGGLTPGNREVTIYGVAPDGRQADKISTYSFDLEFGT